ncbi:MAG: CapA family protein [Eubacteriales bacterium]
MSLEILIGADAAPVALKNTVTKSSVSNRLLDGLEEVWSAADARVISLASPLGSDPDAEASQLESIVALSPAGVCLCGAHILDLGAKGLSAVRAGLKEKHIAPFGAGEDIDEADQPFFYAKHGVRIGFYAIGEDGHSSATERRAGSNPLDLINIGDRVREIKSNCDRLVVFYCGGMGGYPYPSPEVQRVCRKIAACGASLVICQHGAGIGSREHWNSAEIIYGQGAFLAAPANGAGEGLLVRYIIGDYGADKVEYVPIVSRDGCAALADQAKAAEMTEEFRKRSLRIRVEGFVGARFEAYASEQKDRLTQVFFSRNPAFKPLSKLFGNKPTRGYPVESKAEILNALRKESSRELIIRGLKQDVQPAEN